MRYLCALLTGVVLISILPFNVLAQNQDKQEKVIALMESFRYDEALQMTERMLLHDSTNSALYMLKSKALAGFGKYGEAVKSAKQGYQYDSTNLRVISNLVDLLSQSGEPQKACLYAAKRIALSPDNRYFRYQMANLCYQAENYRAGLNLLLPLYQTDSLDVYLMKQIATGLAELEKSDSAILFCKRILSLRPYDPVTTNKLANLFIKTKAYREGIQLTGEFLMHDSTISAINKSNAYLYYLARDYPMAVTRFHRTLETGDSSRFTYKYLGLAYYKQEIYEYDYFRKAYQMDTTENEICFYYGVSASKSYMQDTALLYLTKSLNRLKSSEQFMSLVYLEIASVFNDLQMPDTAMALLMKAYERNLSNVDILFRIAYQYDIFLKKYEDALGYYKEFIRLSPEPKTARLPKNTGATEINVTLLDHAKVRVKELEEMLKSGRRE